MYKPTKEELEKLGFKNIFEDDGEYTYKLGGETGQSIEYNVRNGEDGKYWTYYSSYDFYPESIEDVKTFIKIFKIK